MNEIEQQRKHFESIANKYDICRKDKKHILVKKAIWDYFFSKFSLNDIQNVCVLEAMCGTADGYEILKQHLTFKFNYEAFDYSEIMVEKAKQKLPLENIYCQDVTTFLEQEKYDIIIIIGGLHHVYKHRKEVIANVVTALKKGGFFVNFEPTHNNFLFKKIRERIYKNNTFFDEETEYAFSTKELNILMNDAGLNSVIQYFPGLLSYILWYNPDAFPILNIGNTYFVKRILDFEQKIWNSSFAYYFSFTTLSCFQK